MKCVILAAGRGSRLIENGKIPKPLVQLYGMPLLERQFRNFYQAGIREFLIVVGFLGCEIKNYFKDFNLPDCSFLFIGNDEWQKENGLSLLKVKPYLDTNFCFTMSDHYYDPELIKSFLNTQLDENDVNLAIDFPNDKNTHIDVDDVTKVYLDDSKIINIAKTLEVYQAYDTGLFMCTPQIFTALENSIDSGDATISGGIRNLAKNNKAGAIFIGDYYWNDIDNKNDLKATEEYLSSL